MPVSGLEDVSIRSLRRAGRRFSACSSFSAVRSAFLRALVSFVSFASGGSSSAVNSSLEGRFGSPSAASGGFSFGSSAFAASWKRCWYLLPCWCIRERRSVWLDSPCVECPISELPLSESARRESSYLKSLRRGSGAEGSCSKELRISESSWPKSFPAKCSSVEVSACGTSAMEGCVSSAACCAAVSYLRLRAVPGEEGASLARSKLKSCSLCRASIRSSAWESRTGIRTSFFFL